jgi:hypothetical protein
LGKFLKKVQKEGIIRPKGKIVTVVIPENGSFAILQDSLRGKTRLDPFPPSAYGVLLAFPGHPVFRESSQALHPNNPEGQELLQWSGGEFSGNLEMRGFASCTWTENNRSLKGAQAFYHCFGEDGEAGDDKETIPRKGALGRKDIHVKTKSPESAVEA